MNTRSSGLPYGWWKSPDFWMAVGFTIMFTALGLGILAAWFFDWKVAW